MKKIYNLFKSILPMVAVLVMCCISVNISAQTPRIFYVNKNQTTGNGTGDSWANATKELADALHTAKTVEGTSGSISEIWVAQGTYYPLYHAADGETGDGARDNAFVLVNNVALYGGFPANANDAENAPNLSLTLPEARDTRNWTENQTILSGQRGTNPNSINNNCYHVVISVNDNETTLMDGFYITKAYANGSMGSFVVVNGKQIDRRNGGGIYTKNSSLLLTNLYIDNNRVSTWGGGIYNDTLSKPTIKNIVLTQNQAQYGGGIYNMQADAIMSDMLIDNNYATFGGGGLRNLEAAPTVTNVIIKNNTASNIGGGIHNTTAAPKLTNLLIVNNKAGQGGGIYNANTANPVLTNVTIYGNSASVAGSATYSGAGGIYNTNNSRPPIRNSIIWGNYEGVNTVSNLTASSVGSNNNPVFSNCLLGGATISGGIILNDDPLFVDTEAENFQLQPTSPCINKGIITYISDIATDLANNPRISAFYPDLGAYEFQELTIVPDENGIVYVNKKVTTGDGSGSSWFNAAKELADALLAAKFYAGTSNNISQIWVAEDTYYPKYNAADEVMVNGATVANVNRDNAFLMVENVAVYGGFPENATDAVNAPAPHSSLTIEQARDTRNWNLYPTVLSGDIGTSDDISDNCFHVVVSSGNSNTTVLDGFNITDGNANGSGNINVNGLSLSRGNGGGVINRNSSPFITNIIIENNNANSGAGIYNNSASPVIFNVVIHGNNANNVGGGISNEADSSPIIINTLICENNSQYDGGGLYNYGSSPFLTNVTLSGNNAGDRSGGVFNYNSSPVINNSIIWGNFTSKGTLQNITNEPNLLNSNPQFSFSLIEGSGGSDSWVSLFGTDNGNNIDADPQFTDPTFVPFSILNFQLIPGSVAINAADDDLYLTARDIADFTDEFDLSGTPRWAGTSIDMGAMETLPKLVDAVAITGVTSPVANEIPSSDIDDNDEFTAILVWDGGAPALFDYDFVYTATITLTANNGFTFDINGDYANDTDIEDFTVNGITPEWISNNGEILVFKITFPATEDYYCDVVTNFTVNYNFDCEAELSWDEPLKNDGNLTYNIYRDGALIESNHLLTNYVDDDFDRYAEHKWEVTHDCGSSHESEPMSVIKEACDVYTYIISASTITSFGTEEMPYVQPTAETVTVTNIGTGEITLTQPTAEYYEIGTLSATTLAAGAFATFTVQPKADLLAGNYFEVILIYGNDGAIATVDADFEVTIAIPTIVATNGIVFVDLTKTGNGSSWEDAYPNLADPLILAAKQRAGLITVAPAETIHAIFVAEGYYYPMYTADGYDFCKDARPCVSTFPEIDGGRNNAFVLVPDVKIYGGFVPGDIPAGAVMDEHIGSSLPYGETGRNGETILSGNTDNCYHVVIASNIPENSNTVLDGFTVSGGNADVEGEDITVNGEPIIKCDGGAINISNSLPVNNNLTVSNLIITNNYAFNGGGIYNYQSSPNISNLLINNNEAMNGGGIYNILSSPVITHTTISENRARNGGGINNSVNSSPVLNHVSILGNTATQDGGGILNFFVSQPTLINVLIAENSGRYGGGMHNSFSSPTLTNVTISGNSAGYGSGIYNYDLSSLHPLLEINNTIIWGNLSENGGNVYNSYTSLDFAGYLQYSYSLVQGSGGSGSGNWADFGTDNGNNIDTDPLFVAPTSDFQLHPGSEAINAGDNSLYLSARGGIADFTGETDLIGNPRLIETTVDMGAFETYPILVVETPITGVISPVATETPFTSIDNDDQFTASLVWDGAPVTFDYNTVYSATITLTAKSGYTFDLSGDYANDSDIAGFTVNGFAPEWIKNDGTTLVFTITFPATEEVPTCPNEYVDAVNDITYNVIELAGLCWFTENLRNTKYADGTEIPFAKPYQELMQNIEKFGLLYTYESAMAVGKGQAFPLQGVCPEGWRIPTSDEWALLDVYDVNDLNNNNFWLKPNNYTNDTEFDMRGAGFYNSVTDRFEDLYRSTAFWSSDAPLTNTCYGAAQRYHCNQIDIVEIKKADAVSVRCIQN